ncbi:MAG: phosphomannomutase/phosphoglucomutase [Clostridia bacterium]
MSIYKDCDIRGVYGSELTTDDMLRIGRAIAGMLDGREILVGGDFRTHTPVLKAALLDGLLQGGASVIDLGQLPTPAIYFAKRTLHTYACAQVTASHNPASYNGLKLMLGDRPVTPDVIRSIQVSAESTQSPYKLGTCKSENIMPAYETMLMSACGCRIGKLKVLVDAGNGAMGEIAPRIIQKLGFEVVELFCTIDGRFPDRDPNPAVVTNLAAVCEKMREVGADIGASFDGDGDRVVFIDADGKPLLAEEGLCIFIQALMQPEDSVVYDIKCSSIVKDAILHGGGIPVMERSGHAFIRSNFLERGSCLAGEVSGHFFFRELGADDGLYALIRMCEILCRAQMPLRKLLGSVRYTAITPDIRVRADQAQIDSAFEQMQIWANARQDAVLSMLDGMRLEFTDGAWVLLRRSVTEPAMTLRLETADSLRLHALIGECAAWIPAVADALFAFFK